MKLILEFNLPEDEWNAQKAQNAFKYYSVLKDLDDYLRNICKHCDPKQLDAQGCRDKLWEFLKEEGLDLE